jgi:transposase
VWQKYLGKLENIVQAVDGDGPGPLYAEVFQWGLPTALWKECGRAGVVEETDNLCPKRDQGLSTGEYLAIAAINRATCPNSKRSMWDWFSQTVLLRHLPHVSKSAFASQRFWDHMGRINAETALSIWKAILQGVVKIDTFNGRCEIAKRGKNKQGRHNLRQISYALFYSVDGHVPLFYDVYEGNRNDAKQFPLMVHKFYCFLSELCGGKDSSSSRTRDPSKITLIFDKGNHSAKNIEMLDSLHLHFVGSVKLGEHKDLAQVSNSDPVFVPCPATKLEGTKTFRVKKNIYGKDPPRVTY